ncbi:uncharacterized protein METZ01_LOCUS199061, partial [marine metagenome]
MDGDEVHVGQHLVEAFPPRGIKFFFDLGVHALAVVIVNCQPKAERAPCHRLADPAHADDAKALA